MDHHPVADINAHMGCATGVVGFLEEDQVSGLCFTHRDNVAFSHQAIGRLSAYCGAISAGAGAGAGIAYLCGGDYDAVIHTVVNALAVVSGVICDGAKASCAAKIATAVEAGLLGYNMYIRGNQFRAGDGIVAKGVENSLKNVGRLGRQGMKETNNEIIAIMVGC